MQGGESLKRTDNHPYTIGFFTTGVELEYSHMLSKVITKVAKENNVNIVNFLGGALNPEFTNNNYKYQYQCNVAFNFASSVKIDGIILASGILSSFLQPSEFSDFYSKYSPVPMVSIGTYIQNMPSVYTDNKEAFKKMVNHLIKDHGRKKIGFITGPSSNRDALDRYAGYIESLTQNKLPCNPDYIHVGDFTPSCGVEAVRSFFDEKKLDLDAIVCANDSMALAVLSELSQRNIKVPEQVVLTGFDNIYSAAYSVPSLTTVEQPLDAFAREGFNLILGLIKGKEVSSKMVPSRVISRETCGCGTVNTISYENVLTPHMLKNESKQFAEGFILRNKSYIFNLSAESLTHFVRKCYDLIYLPREDHVSIDDLIKILEASISDFNDSLHISLNLKIFVNLLKNDLLALINDCETIKYVGHILEGVEQSLFSGILKYYGKLNTNHKNSFSFIRQILLSITLNIYNKKEQLKAIIPDLIQCGVKSCLIYLYPKEIIHNLSDPWDMPNVLYLYMGFINQVPVQIDDTNNAFVPSDIISHFFKDRDEIYTVSVHPIFFGNEQLGVIVLELPPESYYLIETLTVEIGCALKLSSVFASQKSIENKLEMLSQTDDLTGLYNRRGFFSKALQKYYIAKALKQNGILFYADMDGLKMINDTFGHEEGDIAITAMADILKNTFSAEDVIGRIGGDEFTILCLDKAPGFLEIALANIRSYCDSYNTYCGKPYKLSITLGALPFSHAAEDSLENLLSRADKLLYNNKKERKKNMQRN